MLNLGTQMVISAVLAGPGAASSCPQHLTFAALAAMDWAALEALYRNATPGEMPRGFVRGRTLYNPCMALANVRSGVANTLWKGKHFSADGCCLINQFLGLRAIRARTGPGESWIDGRPAHILDYAETSLVWGSVRDEMRQVAPGLYVGAMHLRACPQPRLRTLFILESCQDP